MAYITGTETADSLSGDISGSIESDELYSYGGDDTLNPGLGWDNVDGGDGNDLLVLNYSVRDTGGGVTGSSYYGSGSFSRNSADGSSTLDYLSFSGIERFSVTGTSKNDGLSGGADSDSISSGAGSDTLEGGGGNDTLNGGDGNDLVSSYDSYNSLENNASNADNLDGGAGTDTLNADLSNQTVAITLDSTSPPSALSFSNGARIANFEAFQNIYTGSGADRLAQLGRMDNNFSTAGGNDTLNPGLGYDNADGGEGNDLLVVDYSAGDTGGGVTGSGYYGGGSFIRNSADGSSTLDYLSFSGIERFSVTGTSKNDNLSGGADSDSISSGAGSDTLDGGGGNDTLNGGDGNDLVSGYYSYNSLENNASNADNLDGGAGTDTLNADLSNQTVAITLDSTSPPAALSFSNGARIANFEVFQNISTGSGADRLVQLGRIDNYFSTGAGNDTLNPGLGWDNVDGGEGNDLLVVDYSAGDTGGGVTGSSYYGGGSFSRNSADGSSTLDYLSFSGIERFSVTGTSKNDGLYSWAGDDSFSLGAGNDTLDSGDGNDTLNGGTGNDSLAGGNGNDLYVADSASDRVVEYENAGTDTVETSVTLTLGANLENLTLTGTAAINGTGNALNNTLTGNSASNSLNGGAGNDTMRGGAGNDIYYADSATDTVVEAAAGGTDTVYSSVTYTLAAEVENLTLTGTAAINGTGNALNNTLTGNSANNSLNGGAGNDTMSGGAGNDTYYADSATDTVVEAAAGGTDTVYSSVTYTLAAEVENLTLTGTAAINGTGNALNNTLTGNSANNSLNGGAGNDTMSGGAGNDIYYADSATDAVIEAAAGGADTVYSSVTYTLAAEVENLTLTGTAAINGTGNSLSNALTGNAANNSLSGGDGNDTLNGGAGNDTMSGGAGNDIYYADSATDAVIEAAAGGADTVNSSVTYTLAAEVENLTLTGTAAISGTGNSLSNALTGNAANNSLSGSDGNDTLNGGDGADTLAGGNGNDSLVGGAGNDSMAGGLGDDIYVADSAGDIIAEALNAGTDTVQTSVTLTLGANLENLALTGTAAINGTGNALNNSLTGNSANNSLSGGDGNDTLNGGAGSDTMSGGAGNDTYYADSATDAVVEAAAGGADTVYSTVTYTLAAEVENLTLTGTAAINGTGNALNNTLTGNSANNSLNGGAGNDTMSGGAGNDTYYADSATDAVVEAAAGGADTVYSTVTYTLAAEVENLTLTGTAAINGTGNALNNTLTGNSANNSLLGSDGNDTLNGGAGADTLIGGNGNDILVGGAGNDSLTGSAGSDSFLYDTGAAFSSASVGIDALADFVKTQADKIILDRTTFTSITSAAGTGFSIAGEFATVTTDAAAATSAADIVYNSASGKLFYNQNGTAADFGTGAQFATLAGNPALAATDFMIQL